MSSHQPPRPLSRRAFGLGTVSVLLAAPSLVRADARSNISSFRTQHWSDHFDQLGRGVILADLTSRAVHYWGPKDDTYRLYPSSIPMREDLTKRGKTEIVRKRVGPDWTPTQSMIAENPELHYMPPGPDNPLGTHAMYLSWPAYLIHGTHDTRKIGRESSSGCVGLYNEHIAELYSMAEVGTQVLLF